MDLEIARLINEYIETDGQHVVAGEDSKATYQDGFCRVRESLLVQLFCAKAQMCNVAGDDFKVLMALVTLRSLPDGDYFKPNWNDALQSLGHGNVQALAESLERMHRKGIIKVRTSEQDVSIWIKGMPVTHVDQSMPGYVYLLHGIGTPWYKIGYTKNLAQRIKAFNTQGPFSVKPIHFHPVGNMLTVENYWHNMFAGKRAEGEWFTLTDEDVDTFIEWDGTV